MKLDYTEMDKEMFQIISVMMENYFYADSLTDNRFLARGLLQWNDIDISKLFLDEIKAI